MAGPENECLTIESLSVFTANIWMIILPYSSLNCIIPKYFCVIKPGNIFFFEIWNNLYDNTCLIKLNLEANNKSAVVELGPLGRKQRQQSSVC